MQVRLLISRQRSGSHFVKSFIESRFSGVVCSGEVLEKPFDTQPPVLPAHPEIPRFWAWYAREAAAGDHQEKHERKAEERHTSRRSAEGREGRSAEGNIGQPNMVLTK